MTKKFLFALLAGCFCLLPLTAQAFTIVPCNPLTGRTCTFADLGQLLVNVYDFLLSLAGIAALYYMVTGAFNILQGWLSSDPEGMFKTGLKKFKGGIWGVFFIACAYLLVELVLIILGSRNTVNQWLGEIFK